MSASDKLSRKRSVVPRWRSLLNTPAPELTTVNRFPEVRPTTGAQFNDLIKIWKRDSRPEDYADIMDAGIASGSRHLAVQGARGLLESSDHLRERVRERAETILYGRRTAVPLSATPLESMGDEVHSKIARLKRSLGDSPRNSLSHVEIARLYCRQGQFEQAEWHLRVALNLSPNDRFVLRAATRFYTMLGHSLDGLKILRSSDAVQYDPWVQSAELAASRMAGKPAKFGAKAAKLILHQRHVDISSSELAAGWVSVLQDEGTKSKQIYKLLRRSLWNPTENALAQSIWLVDLLDGDFQGRFPNIKPGLDAHEAKCLLHIENEEYILARNEASLWFSDQPFQSRSAIQLAQINFVHLFSYETAEKVTSDALVIHPDDWMLLNLSSLSSIYTGKYDKARKQLCALDRVTAGSEQKAFSHAARGMLSLHLRQLNDGLREYGMAMSICRKHKLTELNLNAAIYMLEAAARGGFVGLKDLERFKAVIDRHIAALPIPFRREYNRIWKSRQKAIADSLNQLNFSTDATQILTPDLLQSALSSGL